MKKMEYKLLNNYYKGLILTRQPELVTDELYITFTGAPQGASAIFQRQSDKCTIYRLLVDDSCKLPVDYLKDEITVRVMVMDGKTSTPVFVCESLKTTQTESGVFVAPDDNDLPLKVTELQLGMQAIMDKMNELMTKYSELNSKFERLLEGYDIT